MTKKKRKERILRTMNFGNKKGVFKGELIEVKDNQYRVDISKQTVENSPVEVKKEQQTSVRRLILRPVYEENGEPLSKEIIKERVKKVDDYMEDKTPEEALEQVPGEVIESKNEGDDPTVLNYAPRIEKDLGFKIQKLYDQTPTTETIIEIVNEQDITYELVESFDFYFKPRSRDFNKTVINFLNS